MGDDIILVDAIVIHGGHYWYWRKKRLLRDIMPYYKGLFVVGKDVSVAMQHEKLGYRIWKELVDGTAKTTTLDMLFAALNTVDFTHEETRKDFFTIIESSHFLRQMMMSLIKISLFEKEVSDGSTNKKLKYITYFNAIDNIEIWRKCMFFSNLQAKDRLKEKFSIDQNFTCHFILSCPKTISQLDADTILSWVRHNHGVAYAMLIQANLRKKILPLFSQQERMRLLAEIDILKLLNLASDPVELAQELAQNPFTSTLIAKNIADIILFLKPIYSATHSSHKTKKIFNSLLNTKVKEIIYNGKCEKKIATGATLKTFLVQNFKIALGLTISQQSDERNQGVFVAEQNICEALSTPWSKQFFDNYVRGKLSLDADIWQGLLQQEPCNQSMCLVMALDDNLWKKLRERYKNNIDILNSKSSYFKARFILETNKNAFSTENLSDVDSNARALLLTVKKDFWAKIKPKYHWYSRWSYYRNVYMLAATNPIYKARLCVDEPELFTGIELIETSVPLQGIKVDVDKFKFVLNGAQWFLVFQNNGKTSAINVTSAYLKRLLQNQTTEQINDKKNFALRIKIRKEAASLIAKHTKQIDDRSSFGIKPLDFIRRNLVGQAKNAKDYFNKDGQSSVLTQLVCEGMNASDLLEFLRRGNYGFIQNAFYNPFFCEFLFKNMSNSHLSFSWQIKMLLQILKHGVVFHPNALDKIKNIVKEYWRNFRSTMVCEIFLDDTMRAIFSDLWQSDIKPLELIFDDCKPNAERNKRLIDTIFLEYEKLTHEGKVQPDYLFTRGIDMLKTNIYFAKRVLNNSNVLQLIFKTYQLTFNERRAIMIALLNFQDQQIIQLLWKNLSKLEEIDPKFVSMCVYMIKQEPQSSRWALTSVVEPSISAQNASTKMIP